jgi:16S rRNA processing protein RimM
VNRLEVGRVAKAHGLRGEVAVVPISNQPTRFEPGARLWAGERSLVVVGSRPHQGGYLVQFAGIDDRNGAEALRGVVLAADAPPGPPPEGELWVHELIGAEVRDRAGAPLGRVVAVEANPAHDLLVLDRGTLVPMVFVVETTDRVVTVELPDGLLDL